MLTLLTPETDEFSNYKCGEIYCQSPTTYNVSCCMCGIRLAFNEFPEHFQKLHLNYEQLEDEDATRVEKIAIDVEVKAESPSNEMDIHFDIGNESDGLSSVDELPIEFMEVKLPKLNSSKASNFIAEHVSMGFEYFEESVDTHEQITISTDRHVSPKSHPKNRKRLTVKKFAMEKSLNKQYEDAETQDKTRAQCRESETQDNTQDITTVGYAETSYDNEEFVSISPSPDDNDESIAKVGRNVQNTDEQFSCKICDRLYRSKRGLSNHIRIVHRTGTQLQPKRKRDDTCKPPFEKRSDVVCDLCGKAFACTGNLNTHKKRHTSEKSHKCPLCDDVFHTDHEMQSHKMKHTNLLPVICEVCGRGFRNNAKLKGHMLRHTGERPAKCDVCHKGFFSAHDLNVHRVTHTKERPFGCEICGSTFRTRKALRIHGRLHISDRTNECKFCGKAFMEASGLDSHIRQVHMK